MRSSKFWGCCATGSFWTLSVGEGIASVIASGAALPIITGADVFVPDTMRGPVAGIASAESSGLPPLLLRAESAANGETLLVRAGAPGGVLRLSEMTAGLEGFRVNPPGPAASLSNCSIGNNRCAWAIFNKPSSRWNRCSCL